MAKFILYLFICIMMCISTIAFTQNHRLTGIITEGQNSLPYTNLSLTANDTILRFTTDDDGKFDIVVPQKDYQFDVLFFNEVVYHSIIILNKDIDLGNVEITTFANLDEIVIQAHKKIVERKADRFIFYVENTTSSSGGTALDALKNTPGVIVNNQNIGISGKNSVLVLIDDKPTYMNQDELIHYLESISTANLSKIEVITTPPAKYEAEGNSGIINIITKKINQNSWNSTIGAMYQRSRRNEHQYNAGFNLQKNKITLRTSVNFGFKRSLINWNNDIYYKDAFWQNEDYSDAKNNNLNALFALDYQIANNWKIGGKTSVYTIRFSDIQPQITTVFDHENGKIQQFFKNNATSDHKTSQSVYNIYSEYLLDSLGKKMTVDFDFVNYHSPSNRVFSYSTFDADNQLILNSTHAGTNQVDIKIRNFSAKTDFELPLKFAEFNVGARFSQSKSENLIAAFKQNETGEFIYDTDLSNFFEYTENNEALYLSGSKEFSDKWSVHAGLRMEATQTKGYSRENDNLHKNDYIKLFPSVYILHHLTDDKSVGLNYSRRINRPHYESLNPFRIINNEFSYNEGNPFLEPAFTHNIELTFTYKTLDSKIYFSSLKNGVNQASLLDPDTKENNYIWMNYVNSKQAGISESYTVKPVAWWTSINTFDLAYSEANTVISDKKHTGMSSSLYTSNDFVLNSAQTLFVNISYFQNFGETFQNYKLKPYAKFYASIKYLMLDKKLELSVKGADIFNGRESVSQEMNGIKQRFKNIWDTQRISVTLTYRFGNTNIKTNERQTSNTDELNRI
ncbi:outer membrane beta-barrel family protein [Myroides indicus]|nr:outer membrane beta-barrel family protein [Myroides indicus]